MRLVCFFLIFGFFVGRVLNFLICHILLMIKVKCSQCIESFPNVSMSYRQFCESGFSSGFCLIFQELSVSRYYLLFFSFLFVLSIVDWNSFVLPDAMTKPFLLFGLLINFFL